MKHFLWLLLLAGNFLYAQKTPDYVPENYDKIDTTITMRDGIKLYTIIYVPRDHTKAYPFLMQRTPYSAGPYGHEHYKRKIGPNEDLMKEKYIFVYQDVRGRYMSEGHNKEVTPYIPNKKSDKDVDESSDTYDTIDWLLKNIPGNNGRVGLYGISYPGFYATTSLPGAHPAIRAVSPQAPVTDEFIGDDANHHGAFFLMDNFYFMNFYGKERSGPVQDYGGSLFKVNTDDAYQFFMDLGPVKNSQSKKYFDHRSYIWNQYLEHDTYDEYWQSRNIRQYLKNIQIPTLVVGGWFDAEDLFGALHTFKALDEGGSNHAYLVMGPWTHGAWARGNWDHFGTYQFGSNTAEWFQDSVQTRFFNYYLKDEGTFPISKITVFQTGKNKWKSYDTWPPEHSGRINYYLEKNKSLSVLKPKQKSSDFYISNPSNPVPYTNKVQGRRNNEYMVEDQSFAGKRADVLSYTTPVLPKDVTLAGSILADLFVSLSTTDADFVVKLIDVIPLPSLDVILEKGDTMTGAYQRLVRAEVFRGKFRNSMEHPSPFRPGKISEVKFNLNSVMHTFKRGHRIMIQVQSSWFPLVDRNPQKFMRIPDADPVDFKPSTIRLHYGGRQASKVVLPVLQ